MDAVFFQGAAAFVSAVLIFCGSVWLLLAMVMGGRLAYFVTASVTLAFVFIMGVVWSINPLGPVGELPSWSSVAIGDSPESLDAPAASSYPDEPWRAPDEEDDTEVTQVGELEGDAVDTLATAIEEGETDAFEDETDAQATDEGTRLLEQDGTLYGMVELEPIEGAEGEPTFVAMKYHPGNPLGPARMITIGTFVLLVLHLIGLSRSESAARRRAEVTA